MPGFYLDRVIPDETLDGIKAELYVEFSPGSTVQDVIRCQTGIGYGGHFDETSPDEDAVYDAIALSSEEFVWIQKIRHLHAQNLRTLIEGPP